MTAVLYGILAAFGAAVVLLDVVMAVWHARSVGVHADRARRGVTSCT